MKLKTLAMLTFLLFSPAAFAECTVINKTADQYINCVITEADCVFAVKEKAKAVKSDQRKKQHKEKTG